MNEYLIITYYSLLIKPYTNVMQANEQTYQDVANVISFEEELAMILNRGQKNWFEKEHHAMKNRYKQPRSDLFGTNSFEESSSEDEKEEEMEYDQPYSLADSYKPFWELQMQYFPVIRWSEFFQDNLFPIDFVQQFSTSLHYEFNLKNYETLNEISDFLMNYLTDEKKKGILSNYLCFWLVHITTPALYDDFNQNKRKFKEQTFRSFSVFQRMDNCLDEVTSRFTLLADHLYTKLYFDPSLRERIIDITIHVRNALKKLIFEASWMNMTTKVKAVEKLDNMQIHVGSIPDFITPAYLNDYYTMTLPYNATFLELWSIMKAHQKSKWLEGMLQDENNRLMLYKMTHAQATRPIISASNLFNYVFISSAIIQPPMFEPDMATGISYGRLGFAIGHEMTYLVDKIGSQFNKEGYPENWWTDNDKLEFIKKQKQFVNLYNNIIDLRTSQAIDGKQTLRANIADFSGIKAAFDGYQAKMNGRSDIPIPGYSNFTMGERTFFVAYGTMLCDARMKKTMATMSKNNVYAYNSARVNVVLKKAKDFTKAFGCTNRATMSYNSTLILNVWD